MNPMMILKELLGKGNPANTAKNLLKNNSNPIFSNLLNMMEKGDSKGIEQFARNVCKEKNIDFDSEFQKFMGNFK